MRLDLIFGFITYVIGMVDMFFIFPFNAELGFIFMIITFILAMITLYFSCKITDNMFKYRKEKKND